MRPTLRHLLPGVGLIIAASAVLLLADVGSRNRAENPRPKNFSKENPARLAILQPASNQVMDDCCKGMLDGLASRGYRQGDKLSVDVLNAQSKLPTIKTMAEQIVGGTYDLSAAISTLCLQSLAKSDVKREMPMVFCGISSPVAADIGIKTLDSLDKPPYLTGYGTAQPVEAIFREMVLSNPKLKVVGVVWNQTEINSEVCTKRARAICKELGLTLIEAPIQGANNVREAADSLVDRGAEAFWTGGDATVINAFAILQQVAEKARIPVFSNISGDAAKGALFDLGANYYQVGFQTGLLAADILDGQSPATIPVRDLMPGRIGLNEKMRATLRDQWTFTQSQYDRAGYVVEADGTVRDIKAAVVAPAAAAK